MDAKAYCRTVARRTVARRTIARKAVPAALLAAALTAALSLPSAASPLKTAIFAGGCFWGTEAALEAIPGVTDAVSGYAGGTKPNPTYGDHQGYREAVKVTYDPSRIGYGELLTHYWHSIDPFNDKGQFCNIWPTYRTAIFIGSPAEAKLAHDRRTAIETRFKQKVATDILPATTFTPAEAYHQDWHAKHPEDFASYEVQCGQPQRLKQIWGAAAS